jgi:hypothetical protein
MSDKYSSLKKINLNFVTPDKNNRVKFLLDTHWSGTNQKPKQVKLCDYRDKVYTNDIDTSGFVLRESIMPKNLSDARSIDKFWYQGVEKVILDELKADWLVLFAGPLLRYSNLSARSQDSSVSAPARAVHSDLYSEFDYPMLEFQPEASMAFKAMTSRLKGRTPSKWRVINYWQMLSNPPQDNTLALCNLQTVSKDDIIEGEGYFHDQSLESDQQLRQIENKPSQFKLTFFKYNPSQEWGYFSNMQPGECLLFSTYDPIEGLTKKRTPHASFDLDSNKKTLIPRRSVEIRALVFWD